MENIVIQPSERTPEVNFDFVSGRLSIRGEAYPENVSTFFGPVLAALHTYLQTKPDHDVTMDIEMEYFNSSSAKALMNIFQLMDEAVEAGVQAVVRWHYNKDDDIMQEFGEDFSEDLRFLSFEMVEID
jgi:hypothetical protein